MIQRILRFFKRFRERATQTAVPLSPPPLGTMLRNMESPPVPLRPYPIRYALDDAGTHFPAGTPTDVIANWLKDAGRELEADAMLEGLISSGYFCLGFWIPHTTQTMTFATTDPKLAEEWKKTGVLLWNGSRLQLFAFPIIHSHRRGTILEGDTSGTFADVLNNWKDPTPDELTKDREFIKYYLTLKIEEEPNTPKTGVG